ncbi:I78 family peptidase inhibitor [Tabrizicola sp.]|uniref:I78 family peptidase inhibitor n=1 Tax=Tabrizicola sp. TaxID=2005166 RepID=UPI00286A9266|nr:I78 family peptidase inhibitor [Tabrizicola sp.]
MMKPYVILAAALALAGCVEEPTPMPRPGGIIPQSTCGADLLQDYIGLPVALLPAGRADVTRRVIRPGDAITEDFSLQRLNVFLDDADVITQLTCG